MKAIPLLLALFFLPIILHAQDQEKLLEHAYKTKSKKELKQFFDNWHKEIPPISDSEFAKLNDLQKEAYKVFSITYRPDCHLLLDAGWIDSVNNFENFYVIHNSLQILKVNKICGTHSDSDSAIVNFAMQFIADSAQKKYFLKRDKNGQLEIIKSYKYGSFNAIKVFYSDYNKVDSLTNFRPSIKSIGKIPVYLTPKYSEMLNTFYLGPRWRWLINCDLNKVKRLFGVNNELSEPFKLYEMKQKRKDFIRNYIPANLSGLAQPQFSFIIFDKTMAKAVVDFWQDDLYNGFNCHISILLSKSDGYWNVSGSSVQYFQLM